MSAVASVPGSPQWMAVDVLSDVAHQLTASQILSHSSSLDLKTLNERQLKELLDESLVIPEDKRGALKDIFSHHPVFVSDQMRASPITSGHLLLMSLFPDLTSSFNWFEQVELITLASQHATIHIPQYFLRLNPSEAVNLAVLMKEKPTLLTFFLRQIKADPLKAVIDQVVVPYLNNNFSSIPQEWPLLVGLSIESRSGIFILEYLQRIVTFQDSWVFPQELKLNPNTLETIQEALWVTKFDEALLKKMILHLTHWDREINEEVFAKASAYALIRCNDGEPPPLILFSALELYRTLLLSSDVQAKKVSFDGHLRTSLSEPIWRIGFIAFAAGYVTGHWYDRPLTTALTYAIQSIAIRVLPSVPGSHYVMDYTLEERMNRFRVFQVTTAATPLYVGFSTGSIPLLGGAFEAVRTLALGWW